MLRSHTPGVCKMQSQFKMCVQISIFLCYNELMITIRPCLSTDWNTLQKLNDEVFQDNLTYDPDIVVDGALSDKGKKYFQDVLHDKDSYCLIAEETGQPVGYIVGRPKKYSYRKGRYFEIDNMGVSPTHRSKGIGSKLIEKVTAWAVENGYTKLIVNAYSKNTAGVAFYKTNGFGEIDTTLERKIKV